MKETKNKFQIETEATQKTIQQELLEKTVLAIDLGLLPKCITEFEFTVEGKQAIAIEYWPSHSREPRECVAVSIPKEHHSKFMFPHAAELHSKLTKDESKKVAHKN